MQLRLVFDQVSTPSRGGVDTWSKARPFIQCLAYKLAQLTVLSLRLNSTLVAPG